MKERFALECRARSGWHLPQSYCEAIYHIVKIYHIATQEQYIITATGFRLKCLSPDPIMYDNLSFFILSSFTLSFLSFRKFKGTLRFLAGRFLRVTKMDRMPFSRLRSAQDYGMIIQEKNVGYCEGFITERMSEDDRRKNTGASSKNGSRLCSQCRGTEGIG